MIRPVIKSTTIPANQALSGAVDITDVEMIAFEMPEVLNATTISFQSKAKRGQDVPNQDDLLPEDWDNVYDSAGSELTATVAANRVIVPTAALQSALRPLHFIRIRIGTSAAPVNINPGAEIRLICK